MKPRTASEWAALLFDEFDESQPGASGRNPIEFPGYAAGHEAESVRIGTGRIGSSRVSAALFDFEFMGGSMGLDAGDRLDSGMVRAEREGIPFLVVTSTGGARIQEGMAGLAQMPRTVAASSRLAAAGIPRIGVLAHPTTGGVYASFASLSDFLAAEAGATIGFAGPRVARALSGSDLPPGSHTAEAAFRAGLCDAVLEAGDVRSWVERVLRAIAPGPSKPGPEPDDPHPAAPAAGWGEFQLARHPSRPPPRFYVERLLTEFVELHGDRAGSDDPAVLTGAGRIGGRPVIVAALDRARPRAGGFRKARRGIELAGRLRLPLLTFVDTPGAEPGHESEYSGLAAEIARTFEAVLKVATPVVTVVTGEGGSGGALALACGDVVGIQRHAVFSVIAPEAAAEILYRDISKAPQAADLLRPSSGDLVRLGLADEVVDEPPPAAHADPEAAAMLLGAWIERALSSAAARDDRAARYSQ